MQQRVHLGQSGSQGHGYGAVVAVHCSSDGATHHRSLGLEHAPASRHYRLPEHAGQNRLPCRPDVSTSTDFGAIGVIRTLSVSWLLMADT